MSLSPGGRNYALYMYSKMTETLPDDAMHLEGH